MPKYAHRLIYVQPARPCIQDAMLPIRNSLGFLIVSTLCAIAHGQTAPVSPHITSALVSIPAFGRDSTTHSCPDSQHARPGDHYVSLSLVSFSGNIRNLYRGSADHYVFVDVELSGFHHDALTAYIVTPPHELPRSNTVKRSVERQMLAHFPLKPSIDPTLNLRIVHTKVKNDPKGIFQDAIREFSKKTLNAITILPIGDAFDAMYEAIEHVKDALEKAHGITYLLHAHTGILEPGSCAGYYVTFASVNERHYTDYMPMARWDDVSRRLVACEPEHMSPQDCGEIDRVSYAVLRITFSERRYVSTSAALDAGTDWSRWLRAALTSADEMIDAENEKNVARLFGAAMAYASVADDQLTIDPFVLDDERREILDDIRSCIRTKEEGALKRIAGHPSDPTCALVRDGRA